MHTSHVMALVARCAGHRIGDIQFNRVRFAAGAGGGGPRVLKRRRWYAPVLTLAGNVYIRLFRLRIRILPDCAWLRRERRLFRALYHMKAEILPGGWLQMPWLGQPLTRCLACRHAAEADKLGILSAAARELHRLHGIAVPEGGRKRRFSHGDAGSRNAAYDAASGRVRWFDFEITHAPGTPDDWRHADDLRAFLFSALSCLPDSLRGQAVNAALDAYPDSAARGGLAARIASGALDTDTYHLAQMQMSPDAHRQIADHILRALGADAPASARGGRRELVGDTQTIPAAPDVRWRTQAKACHGRAAFASRILHLLITGPPSDSRNRSARGKAAEEDFRGELSAARRGGGNARAGFSACVRESAESPTRPLAFASPPRPWR